VEVYKTNALPAVVPPMKLRQVDQELADRLRERVNEDELASYIRMFCISKLAREDALKALYIPGQGPGPLSVAFTASYLLTMVPNRAEH
jgi:predicted DNA-binding ribbon-helix-helix protein